MKLVEQIARSEDPGNDFPTHAEEMKAQIELRIGGRAVATATARATPAGLVSVGVMVAAILLSTAMLIRTARLGFRAAECVGH